MNMNGQTQPSTLFHFLKDGSYTVLGTQHIATVLLEVNRRRMATIQARGGGEANYGPALSDKAEVGTVVKPNTLCVSSGWLWVYASAVNGRTLSPASARPWPLSNVHTRKNRRPKAECHDILQSVHKSCLLAIHHRG